jgi:hypothetical protein
MLNMWIAHHIMLLLLLLLLLLMMMMMMTKMMRWAACPFSLTSVHRLHGFSSTTITTGSGACTKGSATFCHHHGHCWRLTLAMQVGQASSNTWSHLLK